MAATGDGILSQAASDLTGKIETAYLVVHDYRSIMEKKQSQMTLPNQSGVSLMDAAKANVIMDDPTGPGLSAADRKIFRVQFNPSQIFLLKISKTIINGVNLLIYLFSMIFY